MTVGEGTKQESILHIRCYYCNF